MSTDPDEGKKNFRKISATLPQEMYEKLILEAARRKVKGEPNHLLSDLLREAISSYLGEL